MFYESFGERILKISPHLPKLLSNIKAYYLGTLCISCQPTFLLPSVGVTGWCYLRAVRIEAGQVLWSPCACAPVCL